MGRFFSNFMVGTMCLFSWNTSAPGQIADTNPLPKEVVIALKPDKNPEAMLVERQALAEALGQIIHRPIRVITPLSSAVIIEGLANGSIDLGYLSATDMVNARRAEAADLLLVGEIDGKLFYESLWLSLADKPYQSISDLRGRPIAFASRTSTSGYLIPLLDLQKRGLIKKQPEEFFGQVFYGSGYASAVERVLSGEAEAAAVSDYVYQGDKHLTPEQKQRLKIVATQGPVPTHVMAVSRWLNPAARESLRDALMTLGETNPQLRDTVFTSNLVGANAEHHLAPVTAALEFAGQSAN
jgi:phosphonate transport system substrate-binding protein